MKIQTTTKQPSFAEVVKSSLYSFKAQSWRWDYFPAFGSLVTIHTPERTVFGLVYALQTGTLDPGRYPFTYQKTEEELLAEQPQIFEFLQTTFHVMTVGFFEQGRIFYQFAPEPPKMHAFVSHATQAQTKLFFSSCDYLHLIFNFPQLTAVDELLLSLLREQQRLDILSSESFFTFIETISLITGDDYRRLKILITRAQSLSPLIKPLPPEFLK